jgi:hypothetical protein
MEHRPGTTPLSQRPLSICQPAAGCLAFSGTIFQGLRLNMDAAMIGRRLFEGHIDEVRSIAFSPGAQHICLAYVICMGCKHWKYCHSTLHERTNSVAFS